MRVWTNAAVTEIYEWCRLSVSPSRRVWQTGREDAATAARVVHRYNRWIPLTGSLSEAENELLPSRPVSSDEGKDFDRESASWSNEKSDEYFTRNVQAVVITLHFAYRCRDESSSIICMWRKRWHDVIGSSLSIGPSLRVSDGLPCFRGVISGRSNSARRSLARVTGFRASILYAVTAINDNGEETASVFRNSWGRQPPCWIPVTRSFSTS